MEKPYYVIGGSTAVKFYFDNAREPRDVDVIMYKKDLDKFIRSDASSRLVKSNEHAAIIKRTQYCEKKQDFIDVVYEVLFADHVSLYKLILENPELRKYSPITKEWYPARIILYSIKKAHIHFPQLSKKFEKHVMDIVFLRKNMLEKMYNNYIFNLDRTADLLDIEEYTDMHRKTTEKRLGVIKTPKLYNKAVDEFFDQSKEHVKSYYVHDNMHKAMAHNLGKPAYEHMQTDKTKADCSFKLWELMSLQQKQHCVLEEAYVIALERKILPQMFENIEYRYTELEAFKWALMRICTNLCSGWFRWFATINYEEIINQYNSDYVKLFFKNIKNYEKII